MWLNNNNWWEVLLVDKTASLQEIKKAYAKLVKVANNNDNNDLLVDLHTAYAEAKKQLNTKDTKKTELDNYIPEDNFTFDPASPDTLTTYTYDKASTVAEHHVAQNKLDKQAYTYTDCYKILNSVYSNFNKRNKVSEWENLFDSLTLNEENIVDEYGYQFFNSNINLRKSVWEYVNSRLNLTRHSDFINSSLVKDKVIDEYINYKSLDGLNYEESEMFYTYWTKAYLSFVKCEYENVINYCKLGIALYKNNPYIYKMKMISEYELGNNESCLATSIELKEFELEYSDALRYQANVLIRQNKHADAQKLFKEISKKEGDTVLDRRGIIHCLIKRKKRLMTFIKDSTYGNTSDDVYLEYALASRFQKMFVHLGLQKIFRILDIIRVLLVAAVIILSVIAIVISGFAALIVAIPFLIIGVIIYAFVSATKETIAEKRARNE